ncbi:MAG: hypothetical protein HC801_12500 [Nitrospira sp.]|nr:hypothetical protein [Nitrospira sp.]
METLRRHRNISELISEIGQPDTVIVVEEGTARQYSFSGVSKDGTLVVVERHNAPLEFAWYPNPL